MNRTRQDKIQDDFLSRHMSNLVMLNCLQKTCDLIGSSIKDCHKVYKHSRFLLIFHIHTLLRGFSPFEHLRLVEIKFVVSINQWV